MGYNIGYIYADLGREWNTSQWRALTPADGINRHQSEGWEAKLLHINSFVDFLNPVIQELMMSRDILIMQRNTIHPNILDAIRYFQGQGKPVVMDLDDEYQTLPYSNPAKQFWHRREFLTPEQTVIEGGAMRMMERGVQLSNGLVSPNRLLLMNWQYLSGNSYYLPNFAELQWWQNLPPRAEQKADRNLDGKIVIGWGGSLSHYDSWWGSGIIPAARAICERHPEVVWMICGGDDSIAQLLDLPKRQIYRQQGVPPQEWPKVVRTFDIGVAPLYGPYDQNRSWIKAIEYALAGVPFVATSGHPYSDCEDIGLRVPMGAQEWEEALEQLIGNLKSEQEQAEAYIPLAQKRFTVDHNLDFYANVYGQVIEDFKRETIRPLPGIMKVKLNGQEKKQSTKISGPVAQAA